MFCTLVIDQDFHVTNTKNLQIVFKCVVLCTKVHSLSIIHKNCKNYIPQEFQACINKTSVPPEDIWMSVTLPGVQKIQGSCSLSKFCTQYCNLPKEWPIHF